MSTLQPAKTTFIPDQPKSEDHLDFSPYVNALTNLISSSQTRTPLTLGLFGTWGSGKTQLMLLIDEKLKEQQKLAVLEAQKRHSHWLRFLLNKIRGDKGYVAIEPLWINVWQLSQQNTGQGSGWQSFLQALFTMVHERLPLRQRLWFDLKLIADRVDLPEVFRQLLINSYRIAIVVAPLLWAKLPLQPASSALPESLAALLKNTSFNSTLAFVLGLWLLLKPLIESAKDKVSLDLEKLLKEAPYETQISAIQQLQKHFEQLVEAWVDGDGRVIVFIDDLDRCPPDKMTEVLEALKLFATTERCVYVLGVDQEVVAQGIRAKYKDLPIDGTRYLEKIVQLPFLLPSIEVTDIEGYVKSFNANWPHEGCQDIFVQGLPPNPRQIKRAINVFFLLWSLAESRRAKLGGTVTAMRLAKIVALQTAYPGVFEQMRLAPQILQRVESHLLLGASEQAEALKLLDESLQAIVRQSLLQRLFALHRDNPLALFGKLEEQDLAAFFSLTRNVQAASAKATLTQEARTGAASAGVLGELTVAATGIVEPREIAVEPGNISVTGDDAQLSSYHPPPLPLLMQSLHQLPPPPRDFIGREQEIKEMVHHINARSKNVIISGLGGVGKSAFALTIAERVKENYPDAQFFVDLRGFTKHQMSASEALTQIIRGYYPEAKLPGDESALRGLFQTVLENKRVLILLDNAENEEQVMPLTVSRNCLLIVTSRRHFSLPGAINFTLDVLPADAARTLLLIIAPRIAEQADELAQLCGNLPLALRLTASTLAERLTLSPSDYILQLKQAKERSELIAASLGLSYENLGSEQQKLWRALALLRGGFDAGAAAALWQMEPEYAQDRLSELVRLSLVDFDEHGKRYRLHNLTQLFALEQLRQSGEDKRLSQLHAEHFLAVLAQANSLYLAGGEALTQGMTLFDVEYENIKAGQQWAALKSAENQEAARLCMEYPNSGAYVIDLRLHPRERKDWLSAALKAAQLQTDRASEGDILSNLGSAYLDLGAIPEAISHYGQALKIHQELRDRAGEGADLGNLGLAYAALGELPKAIELYEKQLPLAREIKDRRSEGNALANLGLAYYSLGNTSQAIDFLERRLVIAREIGDRRGEANALGTLAACRADNGEAAKAVELLEHQLSIARELGDRRSEATALSNLSVALSQQKEFAKAIEQAKAALAIFEEIEDPNAERVQKQLSDLENGLNP
jgi:tetratricopeptide (TPR) repeat protein/Cdc6-like AAA superfamily ATPase